MSTSFLSFIILSLFMLHELDEIIFIRPWILQNQANKRYLKEMFIAGKNHYLSTENIALMIAEEFLLAFLLLLLAIIFEITELALAIVFCHTIHLLIHIIQVIKFRRWIPGGFSALATFPILLLVFYNVVQEPISWPLFTFFTVILMVFLIVNLAFLHCKAKKLETWIYKISKAD